MKIAVIGTGGVGGYFGGLLARAGHDVTFVARGAHLDAIKRDGLHITSDLSGPFTVRSPATSDTATVGTVDLVIFAVKTYHNPEAIPAIVPMVGPDTAVLTLQNGVDSSGQLADAIGEQHLLTGVAYIQAGGGIVADSEPEAEYQETLHKAGALLRAIDIAESRPDNREVVP